MEIILLVIFSGLIGPLQATHCDKELDYHDNDGYGIDITCDGLTDQNENILQTISVSNEIVLTIDNSNLTKVTSTLFQNVRKIKYLVIRNSTLLFDPNEEIFTGLDRLQHLSIENTKFNHLTKNVFKGLLNLKELRLLNTSLETIRNGTFETLTKLESLKLSRNLFKSMLDIPFCDVPGVKYLDLSYNKIGKIESEFLLCFENEGSDFKLNGVNHEVRYQTEGMYHKTKSALALVELNLSHNEIDEIAHFDWAPFLKSIDLSNNKLKSFDENLFGFVIELEKVDLENNLLEKLKPKTFAMLKKLKLINLDNNRLTEVFFQNVSNLEEIRLCGNQLGSSGLKVDNLPKLRQLLLHSNTIQYLPPKIFQNFSLLENLDLSNNQIVLSQDLFLNLTNLKKLNLGNNSIEKIPPEIFANLSNLDVLDLSDNRLETIHDSRTFSGLNSLRLLNMSHNLLENINYELLKPLHNLQVFDVSGNRLQDFQISLISLLPSLRVINIKSNLLPCSILSNIITFLKSKNISFTINEDFEYDKKNIDGIYCEEMSSRMAITSSGGIRLSSAFGILFLVILSCVLIAFGFFKCLMYARRRRYMDEIELL